MRCPISGCGQDVTIAFFGIEGHPYYTLHGTSIATCQGSGLPARPPVDSPSK